MREAHIETLSIKDSSRMAALLLQSRNVDVLTLGKELKVSFKYGVNYGLFIEGEMVGVASVIDGEESASLSHLYVVDRYRYRRVSVRFLCTILKTIIASKTYVSARNITTFRKMVHHNRSKIYEVDMFYILSKFSDMRIEDLEIHCG